MPWYDGQTLLHYLENVNVGANRNMVTLFSGTVCRSPNQDFRGFAGQVASGRIVPGEEVVVLPSGKRTRVKALHFFKGRDRRSSKR